MYNYKIKLKYDGTDFHGWQIQPNCTTVQGCLEDALNKIFGEKITTYGCSRTDSGVHANEFVCNFRAKKEILDDVVIRAINANIPDTIVVFHCEKVGLEFHSRFDAKGKEYIYKINNSPVRDPFSLTTSLHYRYKLDENKLNKAAASFVGTYDFSAFMSQGSSVSDTVRTIYSATVKREGDNVIFTVHGNGFLYNMVRIMVGTLLGVSEGKIDGEKIKDIILSKNRENAGITAPPCGLYLNKVFYE